MLHACLWRREERVNATCMSLEERGEGQCYMHVSDSRDIAFTAAKVTLTSPQINPLAPDSPLQSSPFPPLNYVPRHIKPHPNSSPCHSSPNLPHPSAHHSTLTPSQLYPNLIPLLLTHRLGSFHVSLFGKSISNWSMILFISV